MPTLRVASLAVSALLLVGCTAGEPTASPVSSATVDAPGVPAADRAVHSATTLPDGRILIAGGCVVDGCGTATADVVIVGADGRTETSAAPMSVPRTNHSATLLPDGRVVVVGGFLGEGEGVTGSLDILDPAKMIATPGPTVVPRGGHAAALLPGGRVLIVGGDDGSGGTAAAEVFDSASGTVSAVEPLPWAADALEATTLRDGRVLVTGGRVARGTATAAAAVYDPALEAWAEVGPLGVPRSKHFQVTLPDGRVLVGGGTPDDRTLLQSTEVFDAETGGFSPGPDLTEPRYKLTSGVIALPDGRVLIGAGGGSIEIVDVERRTSAVVPGLDGTAWFATVSLLDDGSALVLGGYDDRIALTGLMLTVAIPERR